MPDYDAIVIGSGAGGLAAAVALAGAGRRVCVLERHYLPGGWCHTFPLGGHRFSPGVHYLGECGPGGRLRRLYEGLGVAGELELFELAPDGYDRVLVGEERFDYPKGRDRLAERLRARFPAEAAGITRYLDALARVSEQLAAFLRLSGPLDALALPFRAPDVFRHGFRPLESLFDACGLRDPLLRTILSAQCGDHGLPPSRAPVPIHAAVAGHYFDGGCYPKGGGMAIPRAFRRVLRRRGGELRLRTEVERVLTERRGLRRRRRVTGVRLASGEELSAPLVVSNADAWVTYGRLLEPGVLGPWGRRRLRRLRPSCSALSLFLATDLDLRGLGLDSGNVWWAARPDPEAMYRDEAFLSGASAEPLGLFLTATSLKDPTKGDGRVHTLEAFALAPPDAAVFAPWADQPTGARGPEYAAI